MLSAIERMAQFAQRNTTLISAALMGGVLALLFLDFRFAAMERWISFERIGTVGGTLGKLAVRCTLLAIMYFIVRESFVTAKAQGVNMPQWLSAKGVRLVGILRLSHPVIGSFVVTLVLLHGYLMWWVWSAGNYSIAVITGLLAGAVLALLAMTGTLIRMLPKKISLRLIHRLTGLLFVIGLVAHRLVVW